jgi:hypothetical protein
LRLVREKEQEREKQLEREREKEKEQSTVSYVPSNQQFDIHESNTKLACTWHILEWNPWRKLCMFVEDS